MFRNFLTLQIDLDNHLISDTSMRDMAMPHVLGFYFFPILQRTSYSFPLSPGSWKYKAVSQKRAGCLARGL